MSKTIKRDFQFRKQILGKVKNLEMAQVEIAALVHQKPWLQFYLHTTVPVNELNERVEQFDTDFHHFETIWVPYFYRVDPDRFDVKLDAAIDVAQTRIGEVNKITERMLAVQAEKTSSVSKKDLSDPELLMDISGEQKEAMRNLLLAMVMKDENGDTIWDYVNKDGEPVNLTKDFCEDNPLVEDALMTSFQGFRNPTKPSQEATGKVQPEPIIKATTPKTPKVSSIESRSGSMGAEATKTEIRDE